MVVVATTSDPVVEEEVIIETMIVINTINIIYIHDDGSQVEKYGPLFTLCSGFNHFPKHCFKEEHDINNLIEKMSLCPSN